MYAIRSHYEILSRQEVLALLEVDARVTIEDRRDGVMLELLYATGLRVSELVSIESAQINFEVGYLSVLGKGGKQRIVPMGELAARALSEYVITSYSIHYTKLYEGGTYYGALSVALRDDVKTFDSRSSDSIALAIHFKAPIIVGRDLLNSAGRVLEKSDAQVL